MVERVEPQAEPQASIQAGDGRILIEKNKHKHPNASVEQALMEGLTVDQITDALRAYTATTKLKRPIPEEQPKLSEGSERSHHSRRSVFERINDKTIRKEKRNQDKADSGDLRREIEKETEKAKLRSILELRDRIRKEEEAKLEEIIRQRIEEEEDAILWAKRKRYSSPEPQSDESEPQKDIQDKLVRMIQELKNKVEGNIEVEESLTPFTIKLETMPRQKDLKHYNYDSFDGLGNPEEHINYFEQIALIYYYNDLTRCRFFASTLKGGAQK